MSPNQQQSRTTIELPEAFSTSDTELVDLYLRIEGEATIDEPHRGLGMGNVTLYSLLKPLTATDHVDREGDVYVTDGEPPNRRTA